MLTVREYLSTPYELPVPDFVAGRLVERPAPDAAHSRASGELTFRFRLVQESSGLYCFPGLRAQVAADVFRVGDLFVYDRHEPDGPAPLVAAEIVSADENWDELQVKLRRNPALVPPHIAVHFLHLIPRLAQQLADLVRHHDRPVLSARAAE